MRTCVIYNPAAGRGRARRLIDAARAWAAPAADLWPTAGPNQAAGLARRAADDGYERVVAAGGDGTTNEVLNGLMRADRSDVVLGVWPLGSSNDYAFALGLDGWWKAKGNGVPLVRRAVDVGVARGGGREHFFANCAGVGFNGLVALDSRRIKFLRGLPLYGLAYLRTLLWQFAAPPARVTFDASEVSGPMLALTVNVGVREGGFPVTPAARVDDGRFDFVHVGDVRRQELIALLPKLIAGRLPPHPKLRRGTSATVRVSGPAPLCAHADGELVCVPADGVTELLFDTLPGRLWVESPHPPAPSP